MELSSKGGENMKRIMNDVAVQTVCYTISGKQKIRIVDYENEYDCTFRKNGKVVFDGVLYDGSGDDLHNWKYIKYRESKVHGISLDVDTIVFDVFTKYEEYR